MTTIGAETPDTSGSLVQGQRRRSTGESALTFPTWIAETAERNEHRFNGFLLVAGVASIAWGTVAIGLAMCLFVL